MEIYLISKCVLEEQESLGDFSRKKVAGGHHFPPTQTPVQTDTCGNQHSTNTFPLTCSQHTPLHLFLQTHALQPGLRFRSPPTENMSKPC